MSRFMKMIKILALVLSFTILAITFCSCQTQENELNNYDTVNADSSEDTNKSGDMARGYDYCCYAITTNTSAPHHTANTYNYGDEIDICIYMQLHNSLPTFAYPYERLSLCVTMEESPAFEIIGENTFTLDLSESYQDYICDFCIPGARKSLVFNFKIKVNEQAFAVNDIVFNSEFLLDVYETEDLEYDYTEKIYNHIEDLKFITDSQGVIINSIPFSYNHSVNGAGSSDYYSLNFNKSETLVTKSFNREYKKGVSVEELIDRHVGNAMGNNAAVRLQEISKLKFKFWFIRIYEISYSIEYVSENVRFKMYFSEGDDCLTYYRQHCMEGNNSAGKHLVSFALSRGVITQEEYEMELNRLEKAETVIQPIDSISNPVIMSLPVEFEVPTDDGYFNYVTDLRVGKEKTKIVFKFGKD